MKLKIVLKKTKDKIKKLKTTPVWQKMFVCKIDEEKMREYQSQHRLMSMTMRGF